MPRTFHEEELARRPDFVPEGQEYKHPALGGIFHDFIPAGERGISMHGYTADATPPPPDDPEPQKPAKKGKVSDATPDVRDRPDADEPVDGI